MRCCFCNSKTDILMTDGQYICVNCAEEKKLVICPELGKVIADSKFCCDHICNDCIYKEEENE